MLKKYSSSTAVASLPSQKSHKSAWLPLIAVILISLGSHWWRREVDGIGFGSVYGKVLEFILSLLYQNFSPQTTPFCCLALFSCVLFGILWFKSTGIKRYIYYALFAFFAFQYGAGVLFYIFAFLPPFSSRAPIEYFIVFYGLWLAFLLAVLLYEFLSRKRR